MKAFFFALSVLSLVFSVEDINKVEAGHRPCCPEGCPEASALISAELLINNLCTAFNRQDLALVQNIVDLKSTFQQTGDFWTSNCAAVIPVSPFLTSFVPVFVTRRCAEPPVINAAYVDNEGRVIAFATASYWIGDGLAVYQTRYTFVPSKTVACEFILADLQEFWVECNVN